MVLFLITNILQAEKDDIAVKERDDYVQDIICSTLPLKQDSEKILSSTVNYTDCRKMENCPADDFDKISLKIQQPDSHLSFESNMLTTSSIPQDNDCKSDVQHNSLNTVQIEEKNTITADNVQKGIKCSYYSSILEYYISHQQSKLVSELSCLPILEITNRTVNESVAFLFFYLFYVY